MSLFALIPLSFPLCVWAVDIDQKPFYLPNTDIHVLSYKIKLKVPQLAPVNLPAEVELEVEALNLVSSIKLHAARNSMDIQSAFVEGKAVSFSFANDYVLKLDLPAPLPPGRHVQIRLSYEITKAQLENKARTGLFLSKNWHGIDVLSVEDWPYYTRTWVPSNDSPSDPANFDITIDVPKGIRALSNGHESMSDFSSPLFDRFHWSSPEIFPTYGLNLVIGKYKEYKKELCFATLEVNDDWIPCTKTSHHAIVQYFAPESATDSSKNWQSVIEASKSVVFFSSVLGAYRFDKVAFVSAPQHFLMEYPSLITSTSGSVHELAHHWFGNTVWIQHWGDFWISEGFTTYLDEVLYSEFKSQATYQGMDHPVRRFNFPENTDPLTIFDDGPYHGGASALIHLRLAIASACHRVSGSPSERSLFYEVLREIYQTYALHHLGSKELVEFLNAHLGEALKRQSCVLSPVEIKSNVDVWAKEWLP